MWRDAWWWDLYFFFVNIQPTYISFHMICEATLCIHSSADIMFYTGIWYCSHECNIFSIFQKQLFSYCIEMCTCKKKMRQINVFECKSGNSSGLSLYYYCSFFFTLLPYLLDISLQKWSICWVFFHMEGIYAEKCAFLLNWENETLPFDFSDKKKITKNYKKKPFWHPITLKIF